MSDVPEPIIDPMLEELLGGQSPPDLKQRILRVYAAGESSSVDGEQPDQEVQSNRDSFPQVVAQPRRPRRDSNTWLPWASVALVLVVAGIFFAFRATENPVHMAVDNHGPAQPSSVPENAAGDLAANAATGQQGKPEVPLGPSEPEWVPDLAEKSFEIVPLPVIDPEDYERQKSPAFLRERELGSVWPDAQVVAFTNDQLKARWKEVSVRVQRISDDGWYVRASRFLTGTTPPRKEARDFADDPDREAAVASFLNQPSFSSTWSTRLADMLVVQFAPNEKSFSRDQLEAYLRKSLDENKPYDQLVFELITAVGSNDPARTDDFNPAVNFLLAYQGTPQGSENGPHSERKKIEATNIVCQLFLGKQLQCAQCHDHPTAKWSQDDYWQMVSFFVQMNCENLGDAKFRLRNRDFTGDRGNPERAELTYQRADKETSSVFPTFLDGELATSQSGTAGSFDRRTALAKMVVNSDDLSETIVNRLWDQALGSGFTYPVDDMRDQNRPSYPILLKRLATEFTNSGYDLRAALRWITLCSAFELKADPATHPGLFDTFAKDSATPTYTKIDDSIRQFANANRELSLTVLSNIADAANVSEKAKAEATSRFQEKLRDKLLATDEGSRLRRIADCPDLTVDEKIEHLFLSILGRRPTEPERNQSRRVLKSSRLQVNGLRDIGYFLISSKEFDAQH